MQTRRRAVAAALAVFGLVTSFAVTATARADASVNYAYDCARVPAPHHFSCLSIRRTDIKAPATAGAMPSGYSPSDIQSAYELPSSTKGSGQRVYVIDAYGDPSAESDLATYRSTYGLSACTTDNGCFQQINQSGATTPLPATNASWAQETGLDLDMVSAACPLCSITLVEASADDNNLFTAVGEATSLGAKYVSMSWGAGEGGDEPYFDSAYFSQLGIAFVASAGDTGYGIGYPASSPDVISVGGTTLDQASNARGWTESVWLNPAPPHPPAQDGTSSGCSIDETKPTWQSIIPNSVCANRADNDLSIDGDPETGVAVYTQGRWAVFGGTSAGAPLVAGIYALAGPPGTNDNPASYLYEHPSAFNDVVSGADTTASCSPSILCTAGTGWDGPSGLGTPEGISGFAPTTLTAASGGFVSIATPSRVLDTRSGIGAAAAAVGAGADVHLGITGKLGLPYSGVSAVVANITVTQPQTSGFATAFADGSMLPDVSNLNFSAGQTVPNLAVVPIGGDGGIELYNGSGGTAQFIVDITGYIVGGSASANGTVGSVSPARLLDTRATTPVSAGGSISLPVTAIHDVPPSHVAAVIVNLTVTQPQGAGYLTAYADGTSMPGVSNLNFTAGLTVANLAVVPVGSDGGIELYNGSTGSAQFIVDVFGYVLAGAPVAGGLGTETPSRLLDTRNTTAVNAGTSMALTVTGGAIPSNAKAVVVNLTVTQPQGTGYLTAYAAGTTMPGVSNLNFTAGLTVANLAVVPVGADGRIALYNGSAGTIQVIVDITGYFLSP